MKLKRQTLVRVAVSSVCRLHRSFATLLREELGVTAIEYALLASLIVVGASASIALLGGEVDGLWGRMAGAVVGAM